MSETNNALAAPGATTVVFPALPDLVLSAVSSSGSTTVGGKLTVNDTVTNAGNLAAGSFLVGIYLSADATITTSDTLLATRSVSGLEPGVSSTARTSPVIPSTLTPGTYYIGAIADRAGAVVERIEGNNALTGNAVVVKLAR